MPKKYVIFYKKILRLWFIILIAVILLAAYIEYERFQRFYGAIIITIISLVVLIVLYLRSLNYNRKLLLLERWAVRYKKYEKKCLIFHKNKRRRNG